MDFFKRYKKIFLVIGFLLVVAFLAYSLWIFFFRSQVTIPTDITTPEAVNGLPTAGPGELVDSTATGTGLLPPGSGAPNPNEPSATASGGLTRTNPLTQTSVLNPTLNNGDSVQYYNQNDGHFYKLDQNGQAVLMSDKVFHNVKNLVWAPTKDKAIITYPDGKKILYNFGTKQQVTLPSHWQDFSFSPSSDQIVSKSLGLDPENRWLMISNDDGSKAQTLENIGENDQTVYPAWSPNNQIVALYTRGVDFNRQEVFFVGLNHENFKSTIIEGRGFEPQWSTTGDRLLYSVYSTDTNLNPKLWIVDASGETISDNRRSIDLNTWASKCTFASNTEIYCAVPESLERGAGLFPELADKTKDNLYRINLTTGIKELIAVPDGAYNISQIMVPASENNLYFTDKKTNQLYQVKLR